MAIAKGKTDGGEGGKLGHSNQDHWDYTEAIKSAARKSRRLQARKQTSEGLKEYLSDKNNDCGSDEPLK